MAHASARNLIAPHLSLPSYIRVRLAAPLILYAPLSISYALVSVAFGLPFGGASSGYMLNTAICQCISHTKIAPTVSLMGLHSFCLYCTSTWGCVR